MPLTQKSLCCAPRSRADLVFALFWWLQVCLPGGKRDAADSCPQRALAPDVDVATALREAQEELGLDPQLAAPLLALPPVLSKHFLSVTPVVATVPNDFQPQPCADEVAAVFDMPLAAFLEDGAAHEHNDVTWQPGITYRIHSFRHEKGYVVWGLTAGILVHVAQMALGRSADYQVHCPGGVDYSTLHHDGEKLAIRVGTGND